MSNLKKRQADNTLLLADGVRVQYKAGADTGLTSADITKMSNFSENLSIARNGKNLVIEQRPTISNRDTIFLSVWNAGVGNHQFNITPTNFSPGLECYLQDLYLNTSLPIDLSVSTDHNFSITPDVASQNENRFRIVFRESSTLPVNFTAIKAYPKNGNNIQVEWNVANETAISNYDVEKSTDGRNFSKAGTVTATGATSYNWLDVNPVLANNYYRVKSVGVNGDIKYTSVVNVKLGKSGAAVSVYPNPVKDNAISVQFSNLAKGSYTVTLYNAAGQVMATKLVQHNGGSATEQMALPTLSKGLYQLEVKGNETKSSQTIMIQ
jgi:hypothetical protein